MGCRSSDIFGELFIAGGGHAHGTRKLSNIYLIVKAVDAAILLVDGNQQRDRVACIVC